MSTDRITTEGRVFSRQVMRSARHREAAGAGLLAPGTKTWMDALKVFGDTMVNCGPVHAGKRFKAARERLHVAMKEHNACYVNFSASRKRSGYFQLLTFEATEHPLLKQKEGVMVCSYFCRLQGRAGRATLRGYPVTFVPEHMLGRLYERSMASVEEADSILGMLGIIGYLMQGSAKHYGTSLNAAFEGDILIVGVLRAPITTAPFFDCLTVLPHDRPQHARQFEQGKWVADAAMKYLHSDSADPHGYADRVPVVPHSYDDYVTQELRKRGNDGRD